MMAEDVAVSSLNSKLPNLIDFTIQLWMKFLQNSVNDTCNIYLDELKDSLGTICGRDVSESTIWRTMNHCGYHMKKVGNHLDPVSLKYTTEIFSHFLIQLTRNTIEQSVQKQAKYITKIALKYTSNQLVFVDKSSVQLLLLHLTRDPRLLYHPQILTCAFFSPRPPQRMNEH